MPNSAKGAHTSEQQAHQCPSMALCIAAPYEVLSHKIMEMDKEDLCSSDENKSKPTLNSSAIPLSLGCNRG